MPYFVHRSVWKSMCCTSHAWAMPPLSYTEITLFNCFSCWARQCASGVAESCKLPWRQWKRTKELPRWRVQTGRRWWPLNARSCSNSGSVNPETVSFCVGGGGLEVSLRRVCCTTDLLNFLPSLPSLPQTKAQEALRCTVKVPQSFSSYERFCRPR